MRWLTDENIPAAAVRFLREMAHDVLAVAEARPKLPDREVLALARREGRILLSFDRDHGDLIFREGVPAPPAVVYLRLYPASPEALDALLRRVLALGEDALLGYLSVVTRRGLRQRRFPAP